MSAQKIGIAVAMWLALAPAAAFAQATIAGVVRDASGGVLPGVTVEASSPALIEKVRSAVTDGSGQYRVVDLRPGTYTVTFTLTGFATMKREGIELSGTMTATRRIGGQGTWLGRSAISKLVLESSAGMARPMASTSTPDVYTTNESRR